MTELMTLERLRALIAAYGANPARWPLAERPAAEAFLARSPEARAALADVEPLDTLLDTVPALSPSPALRAAVLADMPRLARSGRIGWWDSLRSLLIEFGGLPAVRPLLVASLLLGLFAVGAAAEELGDLGVRQAGEVVVGDGLALLERQGLERGPQVGLPAAGHAVPARPLRQVAGGDRPSGRGAVMWYASLVYACPTTSA